MSTIRTHRGLAAATILTVLILAAAGALALAGCDSDGSTAAEASPAASASAGPITVTDGTGVVVTMDQPATRIVSLAPANTEIAFAIGAGDKMVAGTSYDDYPEEAKSLPKIGDFANPNVEKIASFEPDLVLAAGGIQDKLRSKLEKLGMKVYVVDPKTYDGVMTDITNLGQLTGSNEQAQQVADTMQKAKDDVQAQVASASRPATFLEIYSKPLMTAGGETFIDDMITLAGGTNLGATAGPGFPTFSTEVLFKEEPESAM
jgi:iron complex transport system substrate-binding protein